MTDPVYDPAAGSVGYLTWDEWDRLRRAWSTALKHLPWWWVAGHIRGGDLDEHRARSKDPALPLPGTWLAAHEITRLMQELNAWPELEDAVNDIDGQDFAKLLTREVETAAAKWPMSDRTHRVKFFRCQACQQQTLKYFPPNVGSRPDAPTVGVAVRSGEGFRSVELMDVVVRCTEPSCAAVMDHAMFERMAVMEAYEQQEALGGKRRVDPGAGGAGQGSEIEADGIPMGAGEPDSDHASDASAMAVSA